MKILWRAYLRYRARHLRTERGPQPLVDANGARLGFVDRAVCAGGALSIEGWTIADAVTVRTPGAQTRAENRLPRRDVDDAAVGGQAWGFSVHHPIAKGWSTLVRLRLHLERGEIHVPLVRPRKSQRARGELRLWRDLIVDLWRGGPAIVRWMRQPTLLHRSAVVRALRLDPLVRPARAFDEGIFSPHQGVARVHRNITIVLPVYNAPAVLGETLARVAKNTDLGWHIVIIDDASPDPAIAPLLSAWAGDHPGQVTLISNPSNTGFVECANNGLDRARARAPDDPVVLLNSDAWVPAGWASRLIEPMADPNVASVTPLSNNAEILSVPGACRARDLVAGAADQIDETARRLAPSHYQAIPTGVGFCMALSPQWLRRLGSFDPAFGRGYGEEVDWCQRARALGARNVAQHRLFVEHVGHASFGSGARAARVAAAGKIIAGRYPNYDADVQEFLADDPLGSARLALGLAWAGAVARAPVSIFLGHTLGGGAEKVLGGEIRRAVAEAGVAVVLRVGGARRWRVELVAPDILSFGETDDLGCVLQLLRPVRDRRVVYSCGFGDRDPVELPNVLVTLSAGGRLEFRLHDYFAISPSPFLLDGDNVYRGLPPENTQDKAHRTRRPCGTAVDLTKWRAAWGEAMDRADEVTAFSADSAAMIARAFPRVIGKVALRPHRLGTSVAPLIRPGGGPRVVGVLGNLGAPKGAAELCALARMAAREADVSFVLLGQMDPAFSPPPRLVVHGPYTLDDLAALATRYRIGAWLMPSVCPETFSFTTHEALATGLPVVGFDLGAQGEALRAHPQGRTIPLTISGADLEGTLEELRSLWDSRGAARQGAAAPVRAA